MDKLVPLAGRTFVVASKLLPILYKIQQDEHEFNLTDQLIRSCTSVHANVQEGAGAGSRRDYRARYIISRREAFETLSWLRFLSGLKFISDSDFRYFYDEYTQILKILQSSIKTLSTDKSTTRSKTISY